MESSGKADRGLTRHKHACGHQRSKCGKVLAVATSTLEIYFACESVLAHATALLCSSPSATGFRSACSAFHLAHHMCPRIVDSYLACASWEFDDLQNQERSRANEIDGKIGAARCHY